MLLSVMDGTPIFTVHGFFHSTHCCEPGSPSRGKLRRLCLPDGAGIHDMSAVANVVRWEAACPFPAAALRRLLSPAIPLFLPSVSERPALDKRVLAVCRGHGMQSCCELADRIARAGRMMTRTMTTTTKKTQTKLSNAIHVSEQESATAGPG